MSLVAVGLLTLSFWMITGSAKSFVEFGFHCKRSERLVLSL